jgi:hypothetical protein
MNLFAFLRQGLASVALTSVALMGFANAQSLGFTDDAQIPSWATEAIEELMDQGVVSGNDDGSFAPNRQLNRAEVSKIIVLATGVDINTTGGPHFPDVDQSAWFYDYIETMYNEGWINGYPDGMFRPGVGINRAEIAKMVVNGFAMDQDLSGAPHFDDVTAGDWFYGYVETVYNNGAMRGYGDGTFGPGNAVTRAETAKIVYDAQLVALGSFTGIAEGTLEVMLSNETPRGTNIPFNATSVPYTTVELTASDDADIEISSMTFTRLGLGDNDDFDNVWLEIDGFKVGNDKSVNNDDVVELRFNPPIVIPAGQTLIADVVASMKFSATDQNVGHNNRFVLVSPDDIVSSADNIAGDFPIEGEEMEIASYEVTQLKFSPLGSDTNVDVGDSFIELGKFRMLNASDTNKDVELRAITFKNDGTAEIEDNLENVGLYVSGEQISAETIIDGDYMTFRLDNGVTGGYIVEDGDSRIFSIRADIVSAEKDDVINFKVDNFEDIVGVEIGTAFGVKAISDTGNGRSLSGQNTVDSGTSCTGESAEDNCARLRAYVIEAGDLTISRDPSSLNNQEYAPGSNDVVFLTARLVVDQPIIVDGVTVDVKEAFTNANNTTNMTLAQMNQYFDNFRIYLNDKLIDTENDFTGTTAADANLAFNTTFEIAGTSILKLVGNVQDNAVTGSSIKLRVLDTAFDSPEYISTGDQIETVLGSAEASFVEVEESILTISRTDGFASTFEEIVAGVDDESFLKFVLDNNDSGDVNVTSVTINTVATGNALVNIQDFTAAIFVGGTQQGSSRNLDTNGAATFNDLSVIVDSASQKEFEVVFDTNTSAASGNPVSTTLAAGPGTTAVNGVVNDVQFGGGTLTNDAAAVASTQTIVLGTPAVISLVAGDQIVISAGGTLAEAGAEVKTVASAVAIGDTNIPVTTPLAQSHTGENVTTVVTQYPSAVSTITVTDAGELAIGDTIRIDGATGGAVVAAPPAAFASTNEDYCVAAISGNVVTLGNNTVNTTSPATTCVTGGTNNTLGTAVALGATVIQQNSDATFQVNVVAVNADNVENGQEVVVEEGSPAVALSATNPLVGAAFDILLSGKLVVERGETVFSDILVNNTTDIEILNVKLSAEDDEVQISDLYFVATNPAAADRVTFKLFNAAGALIQTETAVNGEVQFELGNASRIRVPADGNTTVSVRVDVKNISSVNQSGESLVLNLDATKGDNGVEAVTAATGSDLAAGDISVATNPANSEAFLILNSVMTVNSAATQPTIQGATLAPQGIYRFTVSADTQDSIELSRLTAFVTIAGMTCTDGVADCGAATYQVFQVNSSGNADTGQVIGTATAVNGGTPTTQAYVTMNFTNQVVAAGSSRTYELRMGNTADVGLADDDAFTTVLLEDTGQSVGPLIATGVGSVAATGGAIGVTATNPNGNANIIWSDESSNGGVNDFYNGFELEIDTDPTTAQD